MYKDLIKRLGKSILYTVKWEKGHMIDYLLQRDVTKKFYFHCADSLTCGWFSTTSITTKPTCKRDNFITSSHELSNVVGRLILMHDFYFRFQPFFYLSSSRLGCYVHCNYTNGRNMKGRICNIVAKYGVYRWRHNG